MSNVLILGASGRVGKALARTWTTGGPTGIWQFRSGNEQCEAGLWPSPILHWDMLSDPIPEMPKGICCVICLAGVTGNDSKKLKQNTEIARSAVELARCHGIPRVLLFSTQAVYGSGASPVDETSPCNPTSPYGISKLQMEEAMASCPEVTNLRVGNVACADNLLLTATHGPVVLDQFDNGLTPRRSYIGPATLAHVLVRLSDPAVALPKTLNVANAGAISMADVLNAAGVSCSFRPAPQSAIAELELDVSALNAIVPVPPITPDDLMTEAKMGGWRKIACH